MLAEQLKLLPNSRYAALARGGYQFYGWTGPGTQLPVLADVHDRLQFLIPATVGVKVSEKLAYPRPKHVREPPIGTIADFSVGDFLSGRW